MRGTPGKRRADQSGHHPAKRATFDDGESISSAALADSIPFFGAVGALYSDVLPTVSLLATEAPARRYGHTSYVLTLRQFEAAIAHFTDAEIEPLLNAARSNSCKSAPEFYSHLEKVWKGPQSTDHLGFATFFFDAVHYGLKLSPQKVGKYPLGAAVRPSFLKSAVATFEPLVSPSSNSDLAPSLHKLLVEFCTTDAYNPSLPIVRAEARPVTKAAITACAEVAAKCCIPVDDALGIVPISTAEWDSKQLEWGRTLPGGAPVPLCSNECDCQALELPQNQGPLHAYLSPDEEESEVLPDAPHFCLLCIRAQCHALELAYQAAVAGDPQRRCDRAAGCIPPFQNLVDCPGGYHGVYLGAKSTQGLFSVNVVGVSGQLTSVYDPVRKRWKVDQSKLIYKGKLAPTPDFR